MKTLFAFVLVASVGCTSTSPTQIVCTDSTGKVTYVGYRDQPQQNCQLR